MRIGSKQEIGVNFRLLLGGKKNFPGLALVRRRKRRLARGWIRCKEALDMKSRELSDEAIVWLAGFVSTTAELA